MSPHDAGASASPVERWLPHVAILVLAAFCARFFTFPHDINGDTSWLITVVEKLRGGARAYVDVMETNPPMAFLIYWPAVWLAGLTGFTAEAVIYVQTGLVAALSVGLTLHVARARLGMARGGLILMALALVVTFVLAPSRTFTQREHLALMLLLPAVACLAARATGARPAMATALLCGLLAGVGASIKPHFALVVAFPAAAAALQSRDWRVLVSPEALMSGGFFLAYCAVWVTMFRDFFDLPLFLTANAYRLYRYGAADYLTDFSSQVFLLACLVGLSIVVLFRRNAAIVTIAMALVAFALAFVEQGKGFAYHLYPVSAMALILATFLVALPPAARAGEQPRRAALLAAAAISVALSTVHASRYPASDDLRRAIVEIKPRPSLVILTFDIAVNFPLARAIGADWASRLQSTWISNSAFHALNRGLEPAQRERTERAIALEQMWFAQDIARNRPDVVVFDGQAMLDHMRRAPTFRSAFDGVYAPAGVAQGGRFLLFRRTER